MNGNSDSRIPRNIVKRDIGQEDLTPPPGESFQKIWDVDSIKEEVLDCAAREEPPRFCLSKIEIHPSGSCNLKCPFCYGQNLAPLPRDRKDLPNGTMTKIVTNVHDEMPEENPLFVFAGMYSEPLLHPEVVDALKKIGEYGFRFGIYTNGLLMSPNIQNAIIDNANKTSTEKLSFVAFDITASLVSNKFYRELVPIIEHLVNMKNNSECRLQVNTPILAINRKSDHITLYPVVRTLKNIGVDTIRL